MLETNRAIVIAIGASNYLKLPKLQGPSQDVDRLHTLLLKDKPTATGIISKFIPLKDPTSSRFREELSKYALNRTASNDILVLYFSGHGTPLSEDDFGFCTIDTQLFNNGEFQAPIPLNLVRFSDVAETLAAAKIDPVIIIDACHSGQASE